MEKRKVQMTGGSSYIITLPKEWIKKMNIEKNDVLEIDTNPDGSLLIVPEGTGRKEKKALLIDSKDIRDTKFIFRILVGAYIRGYTSVTVHQSPSIPPATRSTVRHFVQNTVGFEIIEEDEQNIEVRDLLDPSEIPPERTIKRMYILVKNMHDDAISGLIDGRKELLKGMDERDMDINRLYWLIAHQYNSLSCSRKSAEKNGVKSGIEVYYFIVAKTIERVGDHAVRISENAMKILESRENPEILKDLKTASTRSIEIFTNSIDSWLRKDMIAANYNIDSAKELAEYCERMSERVVRKKKGIIAVALNNIIESIRRTGEYSADISEMAINYLIT